MQSTVAKRLVQGSADGSVRIRHHPLLEQTVIRDPILIQGSADPGRKPRLS
jgi:hypothetical protein